MNRELSPSSVFCAEISISRNQLPPLKKGDGRGICGAQYSCRAVHAHRLFNDRKSPSAPRYALPLFQRGKCLQQNLLSKHVPTDGSRMTMNRVLPPSSTFCAEISNSRNQLPPLKKGDGRGICGASRSCRALHVFHAHHQHLLCDDRKSPSIPLFQRGKWLQQSLLPKLVTTDGSRLMMNRELSPSSAFCAEISISRNQLPPLKKGDGRGICDASRSRRALHVFHAHHQHLLFNDRKSPSIPLFQRGKCLQQSLLAKRVTTDGSRVMMNRALSPSSVFCAEISISRNQLPPLKKGDGRGICGIRLSCLASHQHRFFDDRKSPSIPLFQRGKCLQNGLLPKRITTDGSRVMINRGLSPSSVFCAEMSNSRNQLPPLKKGDGRGIYGLPNIGNGCESFTTVNPPRPLATLSPFSKEGSAPATIRFAGTDAAQLGAQKNRVLQ